MSIVLTTVNVKGGIGRSTISSYVSMELAEQGYQVCVLDLGQNSSIATSFLRSWNDFEYTVYDWLSGVVKLSQVIQKYSENLFFIPGDVSIPHHPTFIEKEMNLIKKMTLFKENLDVLKESFDYIIIDTPTYRNYSVVPLVLMATDYALIPFEVDEDSKLAVERTVEKLNEFIKENYLKGYFIIGNKIHMTDLDMVIIYEDLKNILIANGINKNAFIHDIRASTVVPSIKLERKTLYSIKETDHEAESILKDYKYATEDILATIKKT